MRQRVAMTPRPRFDRIRSPWFWIGVALLVHSAALLVFPPRAWLVRDEVFYVKQAEALAHGRVTADAWDTTRGAFVAKVPSPYPPGTSLLMALPVRLLGPRGAVIVPWMASIVLVVATGAWLRRQGQSPLFALLTLAYLPTLALSRLAMSDVPSAAVVACALLLFALGAPCASTDGTGGEQTRAGEIPHGPGAWLGAGFLCGASMSLRETNPLVLIPLFAGVVLRRERNAWALVVGAGAGAVVRISAAVLLFGDPFFYKMNAGFSAAAIPSNLAMYLSAAMCLVPAGLYWVLRYRGPQHLEILATVFGFILLYSAYQYSALRRPLANNLILGPRYLIPLTPLFALCAAHAYSVARERLRARAPSLASRALAAIPYALATGTCALALAAAAAMHSAERPALQMQRAIAAHVRSEDLVITDLLATEKMLFGVGHDKIVDLTPSTDLAAALRGAERVWLIVLDRDDSAFWRARRALTDARLARSAMRVRLELVLDHAYEDQQRLRVFRMRSQER